LVLASNWVCFVKLGLGIQLGLLCQTWSWHPKEEGFVVGLSHAFFCLFLLDLFPYGLWNNSFLA